MMMMMNQFKQSNCSSEKNKGRVFPKCRKFNKKTALNIIIDKLL